MIRTALVLAAIGFVPMAASAQSAASPSDSATTSSNTKRASLPLPFRGGPLVTGVNVFAGSAFSIRTASNNEKFAGAKFSMATVQFTRTLFVRKDIQFSWIIEVVPAIVATVGAPTNRLPTVNSGSGTSVSADRYRRYVLHDVYGVGLAPLSAEASRPLFSRLSATFSVTSGGAFFSSVIPYGKATQANFTVAPSLALGLRLTDHYELSSGYALHHLSNASFGDANPGLNSHMVFLRLSKARSIGKR